MAEKVLRIESDDAQKTDKDLERYVRCNQREDSYR